MHFRCNTSDNTSDEKAEFLYKQLRIYGKKVTYKELNYLYQFKVIEQT